MVLDKSESRNALKRAPILPRVWKKPVYVLAALVISSVFPPMVRNTIQDFVNGDLSFHQGIVAFGPLLILLYLCVQFWWAGFAAKRHVTNTVGRGPNLLVRQVRMGLRGAFDLGEACDAPVFVHGNLHGLISITSDGIVFWNEDTLDRECTLSWTRITSVQPVRVDTAIWKSWGVQLAVVPKSQGTSPTLVGVELRSRALSGLIPCSKRNVDDFIVEALQFKIQENVSHLD